MKYYGQYFDSLVQDYSDSSALAIGLLQSLTKRSIYKDKQPGCWAEFNIMANIT